MITEKVKPTEKTGLLNKLITEIKGISPGQVGIKRSISPLIASFFPLRHGSTSSLFLGWLKTSTDHVVRNRTKV